MLGVVALPVGGKALQVTNSHCGLFHLQADALALALLLLRTHATTHCWQRTGLLEGCGSLSKLATLDVLDEFGDVDAHWAASDALWIGAVEATSCLEHSLLGIDALVNLLVASDAVGRIELWHLNSSDIVSLFSGFRLAQLFTPSLVARFVIVFHLFLVILVEQ